MVKFHPIGLVKLHVIPVDRQEHLTLNLVSLLFQKIFKAASYADSKRPYRY